jgi:hypothetical protein
MVWRMIVKDGLIGESGEHRRLQQPSANGAIGDAVFPSTAKWQDVRDIEMATTSAATVAEKGRRIVGAERQTLAKDLVKRYTSGESIRALASSTGRSYGFVHRVLTESGVQLRQRGGARRRKKVAS